MVIIAAGGPIRKEGARKHPATLLDTRSARFPAVGMADKKRIFFNFR
jgi:hypothetical protein